MADYNANARTNYFKVKDVDAFKADLEASGIEVGTWESPYAEFIVDDSSINHPGHVALFSYGSWPQTDDAYAIACLHDLDEDEVEAKYDDLFTLVAAHLTDDSVAVFMEVGFEKMRYLFGAAVAVNSSGEQREITLDNIYDLAAELLPEGADAAAGVTRATY